MMIDSDMIEGVAGYNPVNLTTNSHWIVYEGGLTFFDIHGNITAKTEQAEKVVFSIYTWGLDFRNDYLPQSGNKKEVDLKYKFLYKPFYIDVKSFKSNYYGYIEIF